jgi:hypothetical protein
MTSEPPETRARDQAHEVDPEKLAALIETIDRLRRRQRMLIVGYAAALVLLVSGLLTSFWLYGALGDSPYKSMVFLIPLALAAGMLWLFGRMARTTALKPK